MDMIENGFMEEKMWWYDFVMVSGFEYVYIICKIYYLIFLKQ